MAAVIISLIALFSVDLNAQMSDSAFDELDSEVQEAPLQDRMDLNKLRQRQDAIKRTLQENMAVQEAVWGELSKEMEIQWTAMVKRVHAQREALRQRVEQQWDDFQDSNNKEWVDYSAETDSRSRVDFENGEVEFSTLIPVKDLPSKKEEQVKKAKELATVKVKKQIRKVLSTDNDVKKEVLKDQIKDPEGKNVTKENAGEYVEKHVTTKMKVEEKPVVAKDGVPRVKVTVKVKMVPQHLRIRAEKYKSQVNSYAAQYSIDPALIYALIHTESYFNPLAKSYIPAYGLMQLVPKSGAMDAYYYLHKKKKILPGEYLYDPDNNVKLGSTYFHILNSIYLKQLKNVENREALSIAAYNWGIGNIKKKIIDKNNVDTLSRKEVVALIDKTAPKETRDYVRRVEKRKAIYQSM